jgi:hypothetical protein
MTRRIADPHLRFNAWLVAGAEGELARDLALHASVCGICVPRVAALDLLTAVDTGRASVPVLLRPTFRPAGLRGVGRFVAAFAGVTVAAALIGLAGSQLIELRGAGDGASKADPGETPGQAVLGGTGRSSPTPSQTEPSETPAPSAAASTAEASTPTALATPAPFPAPGSQSTPRPATPRPSASASASASPRPVATPTPVASPVPTPTPTATPTDTPTPEATPTPAPDDCADGIDNDGDTFIDGLDPGCVLDGNEPSA